MRVIQKLIQMGKTLFLLHEANDFMSTRRNFKILSNG